MIWLHRKDIPQNQHDLNSKLILIMFKFIPLYIIRFCLTCYICYNFNHIELIQILLEYIICCGKGHKIMTSVLG